MAQIISMMNHKGGTGKTTVTFNLAFALAHRFNKRVLLVDLDPQSNLTLAVGYDTTDKRTIYDIIQDNYPVEKTLVSINGVDLIPADLFLSQCEISLVNKPAGAFCLRRILKPLRDSYDYILIDCPPSAGILCYNALTASDGLMVIMNPDFFSAAGVSLLMNTIQTIKIDELNPDLEIVGVVINKYDGRKNLHKSVAQKLKNSFGIKVYKTMITDAVSISESVLSHVPVFEYKTAAAKAKVDFLELTREFIEKGMIKK